jgi:nicotinamidase-related amidase
MENGSCAHHAGPNGALPKEITKMHPTAPFIHRQGEVDAWDNPAFRSAVQATGKKQIILAGIVTEVCKFLPLAPSRPFPSCTSLVSILYRNESNFLSSGKVMGISNILEMKGTAFLALSLREAGYEVWANTDASGTFNDKLAADANRRMEQAGVHLMGLFGITMDLMRDW